LSAVVFLFSSQGTLVNFRGKQEKKRGGKKAKKKGHTKYTKGKKTKELKKKEKNIKVRPSPI